MIVEHDISDISTQSESKNFALKNVVIIIVVIIIVRSCRENIWLELL